jgi:acyl dehydratase
VRNRTIRLEAPERVRPTGELTPEAALTALEQARAALIEACRAATPDELDHAAFPHPFFGPLTLRAWVELSAHHDSRHAQQLADLATAAAAGS